MAAQSTGKTRALGGAQLGRSGMFVIPFYCKTCTLSMHWAVCHPNLLQNPRPWRDQLRQIGVQLPRRLDNGTQTWHIRSSQRAFAGNICLLFWVAMAPPSRDLVALVVVAALSTVAIVLGWRPHWLTQCSVVVNLQILHMAIPHVAAVRSFHMAVTHLQPLRTRWDRSETADSSQVQHIVVINVYLYCSPLFACSNRMPLLPIEVTRQDSPRVNNFGRRLATMGVKENVVMCQR